jgi:hypothetical protein
LNSGQAPGPAVAGNPIIAAGRWAVLPLFPLQAVLFPGGVLQLKVFEARYLDLISACLRGRSPFGVVCLARGGELRGDGDKPKLESTAVLATVQEVDAEQAGILRVRCLGGARVLLGSPHQRADGLWLSDAQAGPEDMPAPVPPALADAANALAQAIVALAAQDQHPFALPHRLDEAGWVANRWCEILPISTAAKYRLMVLDAPLLRLKLVDEYLRGKGIL